MKKIVICYALTWKLTSRNKAANGVPKAHPLGSLVHSLYAKPEPNIADFGKMLSILSTLFNALTLVSSTFLKP